MFLACFNAVIGEESGRRDEVPLQLLPTCSADLPQLVGAVSTVSDALQEITGLPQQNPIESAELGEIFFFERKMRGSYARFFHFSLLGSSAEAMPNFQMLTDFVSRF
jgi:hypothetical protein